MISEDLDGIKDILISGFDDFLNYNILKYELEDSNSKHIVTKTNDSEIIDFACIKVIFDNSDVMNIVLKSFVETQVLVVFFD